MCCIGDFPINMNLYFTSYLIVIDLFVEEFKTTLEQSELNKFVKFDFDTDFVKLHFGAKRNRRITYSEFTQVLWVCDWLIDRL